MKGHFTHQKSYHHHIDFLGCLHFWGHLLTSTESHCTKFFWQKSIGAIRGSLVALSVWHLVMFPIWGDNTHKQTDMLRLFDHSGLPDSRGKNWVWLSLYYWVSIDVCVTACIATVCAVSVKVLSVWVVTEHPISFLHTPPSKWWEWLLSSIDTGLLPPPLPHERQSQARKVNMNRDPPPPQGFQLILLIFAFLMKCSYSNHDNKWL